MAFSRAVKLTDLDDFLTPSQSCVKPLLQPSLIKATDRATATVSLSDCLHRLRDLCRDCAAAGAVLAQGAGGLGKRQSGGFGVGIECGVFGEWAEIEHWGDVWTTSCDSPGERSE